MLIGSLTLSEYLFRINVGIDQLIFHDLKGSHGTSAPGRMSPMTAMVLLTTGLALLLLNWETRRGRRPSQAVSLCAGLIAMMVLSGYIYHAMALTRILFYTQMALHTSIAFSLLSVAVFFARPRSGIAGDLTGEGSGSVMARRFLPAVFLIPVVLGWIRLQGQYAGFYGTELGLSLYVTSSIVIFAVLMWLGALRMNREYEQRQKAEVAIRDLNADLEIRVADRTRTLERQTSVLAEQAALLGLAHDAIVVRDMQNRILFWNRGAEVMYGWTAKEAIGTISLHLLKTEFSEPLAEIDEQLFRENHWEGEAIHCTRDGTRLNVGCRWALQRDKSGAPVQVLSIIHDITGRKLAEESLRLLTQRLSLATSTGKVGVWDWDIVTNAVIYDKTMFEIYGFAPSFALSGEQSSASGQYAQFMEVIHPEDVLLVEATLQRVIAEKSHGSAEFRLKFPDGSIKYISAVERAVLDEHGNVARVIGVNMDVSERKLAADALFAEKERAQVTLNSIGDAVICTDISGNVTFLNLVAEKMTGWPQQDATGRPMVEVFQILDGSTRATLPNPMETAIGQNQTVHLPNDCVLIRRDGYEIPIEDSVAPIHGRDGKPTGAVIVFRDVSDARAMSLSMTHSAQHDFPTGLPNRMLLNEHVRLAIALAPRHAKKLAILFLDLDGFKHINDSLGHPLGDKLLQSVAKGLLDCVRASDTVSRQGGDEFVVLLSEIEQAEDAAISARRILEAVGKAHGIDDHDLHVTTSIGISVYPDDGMDAETLIKNADLAMYQAKENGHQSFKFFKSAMNERAVARQSI
jgi:diguanylate cyclase (GGDEF)-like protein/PAS domain S-box-containing protein